LRGQAVLQRQTERAAEALDQARERRALLAHLDEDLARMAGEIRPCRFIEETDRQVAFVSGDGELVRDRLPRRGPHIALVALIVSRRRKHVRSRLRVTHEPILLLPLHRRWTPMSNSEAERGESPTVIR